MSDNDRTTAIIVAATQLHEALWHRPELLKTLPENVINAYGNLQGALKNRRSDGDELLDRLRRLQHDAEAAAKIAHVLDDRAIEKARKVARAR